MDSSRKKGYPTSYKGESLGGAFRAGMVKNWYISLAISAMSVMFGSLGSTVSLLHHMATAETLTIGGILGGHAFLGSALGALILPSVFEKYNRIHTGLITTGELMFMFIAVMTLSLSYSTIIILIGPCYFFFGILGNPYCSMAMTMPTRYVTDPA